MKDLTQLPHAAIALLVILGGAAIAQGQAPGTGGAPEASPSPAASVTPGPSPTGVAAVDEAYAANYLHHLNQQEVREGNQALSASGASSAAVEAARTIIDDHLAHDQRLLDWAAQGGRTIYVTQPASDELAASAALSQLSGTTRDQAFVAYQHKAHELALSKLQAIQPTVTDPGLRQLLADEIALVQKHAELTEGAAPGATPSPSASASPGAP